MFYSVERFLTVYQANSARRCRHSTETLNSHYFYFFLSFCLRDENQSTKYRYKLAEGALPGSLAL